jgi:hypothetical protein
MAALEAERWLALADSHAAAGQTRAAE